MTRDWECIRAILIALEQESETEAFLLASDVPGFAEDKVTYAMLLLDEAGLICTQQRRYATAPISVNAVRMTWAGHELLDSIRSRPAWNKIKQYLSDEALPITLEGLKAAISAVIRISTGE